ncbi:MAG: sialate O-acetylesterase [Chitinophagaceae bacterium]
MTRLYFLLLFISLFFIRVMMFAQVRLPSVISSGMVLQQNDSVTIWGWAGPGEKVFVIPSWSYKPDSAITSNGARWKMKIKTPAAGGPFTLNIASSGKATVLSNVMIGEVWVCSGQSNMEWSYNNGEMDTRAELPVCATNSIHFFHVPKTTSDAPQDDVKGQWVVCDSNTLKSFSAVGYFFGKKLLQQLNVPIGLINTSWGGTPAEVWTPQDLVNRDEVLKTAAGKLESFAWWPSQPGLTYNAMIAPLTPYNIAGAIWYQGESNVITNDSYSKLFTTMIGAWRGAWKKDFPFYYVQIAPYKYGNNNTGALLQEAQTKSMAYPNVGMVVITDLIDSVTNIHPSHKREVGNRLANWALAETYKRPRIIYKNPEYKSARESKVGKAKDPGLLLSFNNIPNGLQTKDNVITGFYISGGTENWQPAEARLEKGNKIVLWNKDIKEPRYIRYGFGNTLTGNVFSAEGLPLLPFRVDTWPVDQSKL